MSIASATTSWCPAGRRPDGAWLIPGWRSGCRTEHRLRSGFSGPRAYKMQKSTPDRRPLRVRARRLRPVLGSTSSRWPSIGTGLRQVEFLGLRWDDVDLEARQLRVVYQLQSGAVPSRRPACPSAAEGGRGRTDIHYLVRLIWEWPSISITTLAGTPAASRKVAQVCLRSWNRTSRNPCFASSAFQERTRLRGLIGVPTDEHLQPRDGCRAGGRGRSHGGATAPDRTGLAALVSGDKGQDESGREVSRQRA